MDIFMTIGTKILPITSVRRIIQVVSVFVVDRQKMSLGRGEFPTASGTDQTVQGQGSFPVIFFNRSFGSDFRHNLLYGFIAGWVGF
jgi:hypothetical protein